MSFDPEREIRWDDSESVDAFGNGRVANAHILLSGQLVHADNPLVWGADTTGGGGGSYDADESAFQLSVGAASGDESIRQTKRYYLYRAGQSQLCRVTFAEIDPVASVRKRVGYFDADDGLFLEVNGLTDVAIVRRSSTSGAPVDDRIVQADWNIDTLGGAGPSAVTLDLSKIQHLVVDLQWLGAGRVRAGFDIGGRIRWCHEFNFANELALVPYMKRASLPVRYEITNTAASAGATFKQICSAVIREGGDEEEGIPTVIRSSLSTPLTTSTTIQSAINVRLRATHIRAFAKPLTASLVNFGGPNEQIVFDLILNPTLAGGALTFANIGLGLDVSFEQRTYTPGTGHPIAAGIAIGGTNARSVSHIEVESALGIAADIAGVGDIISIITEAASGTPAFVAVLQMLEQF